MIPLRGTIWTHPEYSHMNTLAPTALAALLGCGAGCALSSLAQAQSLGELSLPFKCTLSYPNGVPSSPLKVMARDAAQARQKAATAATPSISCEMDAVDDKSA